LFREQTIVDGYFCKDVKVKKSKVDGLGVFAEEDIPLHTCFEAAPYINFATSLLQDWWNEWQVEHILKAYVFRAPAGTHAMALGYSSIYNHSAYPNAFWKFRETPGEEAILFYAKKDIKKGEEIFIKYGLDSSRLLFLDEKESSRLGIVE
jgi:SET domain-containing protein|tara:strand:+ start:1038 stop:1487 length:450 start_codon:yes stop_codon:yes gene_type:complete